MTRAAHSSRHDEALQETAARLIFVLAYKKSIDEVRRPHDCAGPNDDLSRRGLPQSVTERHQIESKNQSPCHRRVTAPC